MEKAVALLCVFGLGMLIWMKMDWALTVFIKMRKKERSTIMSNFLLIFISGFYILF